MKSTRLKDFVVKKSIRAESIPNYEKLEVLGVSNQLGITITGHKKSKDLAKYQLIQEGDFAYNPYRINVGSIGLTPAGKKGLVSPAYVVFRTTDHLIPELLLDFLKSQEGLRQIGKYARGTVRKALRFEDLRQIELPIPSMDRQLKILSKRKNVKTVNDLLQSELTHQQNLLKKLRQQILQEAIEGKLTADWRAQNRDVEPAGELLKRIAAEKAQLIKDKKIRKQKPLPPITEEEKPFELPQGWEWCRLEQLLLILLGGHAFKSPLFKKSGTKQVLRLGNIRPYKLRLDEKPVYISEEYAKKAESVKLSPGDILITMTGTRKKRDYCYTVLLEENDFQNVDLYLNQRVGCFRFGRAIIKRYYDYCFKDDRLLDQVFSTATGTANQANIGSNTLRSWLVPLPSAIEQQAIVTKVEKLLALCDQLEARITHNQTHAEQLLQAVLQEAFSHNNDSATTPTSSKAAANTLESTSA